MVAVDEASVFKNGRKRTATKEVSIFGAAAKARKFVKRIVLMTGTPTPKGLKNLWGLAYIADLGERLGTARTKFEERWFDKDYMGWNLTPKPHAQEEITKRLSDIMFTLDPELYPDLPPLLIKDTRVTLPSKVMEEYRRFKATLVSEAYDIEAVNKGVLASKLLQFASGSMYDENGKDVWVHDRKLEALEDIIEEADGEPVLVAYNFKFDLARIRKKFKKAVVFGEGDVRKTKADWNAGKIDLMLAHPQSVGHGQNIQFGGNIMVWYGLTHDLEIYQQMNKRLHRPGQTRPVTLHHIIAKGTYDEEILPRLQDKATTQDEIMAALRLDLLGMKRR
jgi:SNF2 family DNA or RNA helicase